MIANLINLLSVFLLRYLLIFYSTLYTFMSTPILFILACLVFLSQSQGAFYKRVLVDDKDALCLDGTKGAYYISQGKSATKFMLFFEGGGWCGDSTANKDLATITQSCYQRSLTDLGSSKNYPESYTISDGILSLDSRNNFNDFTKVFFKYCDGSGHQGTRSKPILYKETNLYFRGSNLTISKLNDLEQKYGLFSKSTEIFVTGISAGGLAAFTWADYIRERSTSKNVYSAPDSGIFLDSPNFVSKQHEYRTMFANLFKLSNTQSNPPVPECVKFYSSEPYLCMLAENMHRFIKTPLFPIQSLYDSWSLPNILGIRCARIQSLKECNSDQLAFVEAYHRNTSRVLQEISSRRENGCWAPVCVDHGYIWSMLYSPNYEIPMHSSNTVGQTLFAWSQKKEGPHKYIDKGSWPDNKPCSGVSLLQE